MPKKTPTPKDLPEEKNQPPVVASKTIPQTTPSKSVPQTTAAAAKESPTVSPPEPAPIQVVNSLTKEELEAFREDYREKDREIQRNIGVYLSGLVLITGWLIGPQTKPLIRMALDNYGYNLFGFIIVVALNVVFLCFLIYKSLLIHEIMQFVVVHSRQKSGFNYWEAWRRSKQSATNGSVRVIYNVLVLTFLPVFVSLGILIPLGYLLFAGNTQELSELLKQHEAAASPSTAGSTQSSPTPVPSTTPQGEQASQTNSPNPAPATSAVQNITASPEQLNHVFFLVKWFFVGVCLLHLLPFWFFYQNVGPINERWEIINKKQIPPETYKNLDRIETRAAESNESLPTIQTSQ